MGSKPTGSSGFYNNAANSLNNENGWLKSSAVCLSSLVDGRVVTETKKCTFYEVMIEEAAPTETIGFRHSVFESMRFLSFLEKNLDSTAPMMDACMLSFISRVCAFDPNFRMNLQWGLRWLDKCSTRELEGNPIHTDADPVELYNRIMKDISAYRISGFTLYNKLDLESLIPRGHLADLVFEKVKDGSFSNLLKRHPTFAGWHFYVVGLDWLVPHQLWFLLKDCWELIWCQVLDEGLMHICYITPKFFMFCNSCKKESMPEDIEDWYTRD